jgi:hypothetical protein
MNDVRTWWDMWGFSVVVILLVLRLIHLDQETARLDIDDMASIAQSVTQSVLPSPGQVTTSGQVVDANVLRRHNAGLIAWAAANITGPFHPDTQRQTRTPGGGHWVSAFLEQCRAGRRMNTKAPGWQKMLQVVDGCLRFVPSARYTAKQALGILMDHAPPPGGTPHVQAATPNVVQAATAAAAAARRELGFGA